MPAYTVCCGACGRSQVIFRHIRNRDDDLPQCHGPMARIVEAPSVQTDLPGYQSPVDGRWIEGRVARNEDLKRNNCRPWEGMETERREAVKRAEEADLVFEQKTESALHETFNNMSAEKQRVLSSAFE